MPNTLGGINLAQIAEETLKALLPVVPAFRAFTTDFSMDVAQKGESVTTRVPTAVSDADASSGYSSQAVTSTAKTVTLNQHRHFTMGFTDLEVSKAGGIDFLKRVFIEPAINAVVLTAINHPLALVTAANFGAAGFTGAAATFDADDVADLAQALSTAKVTKLNRFMLLKPTYYASLVKDNAIQNASASGSTDAIREGLVRRVHGFEVIEYSDLPDNSENLVGVCGAQQGLLMAARLPETPGNWFGDVENVQEAQSGFPLQLRMWYEGKDGQTYITVTSIYGRALGVTGNVSRLVSA